MAILDSPVKVFEIFPQILRFGLFLNDLVSCIFFLKFLYGALHFLVALAYDVLLVGLFFLAFPFRNLSPFGDEGPMLVECHMRFQV